MYHEKLIVLWWCDMWISNTVVFKFRLLSWYFVGSPKYFSFVKKLEGLCRCNLEDLEKAIFNIFRAWCGKILLVIHYEPPHVIEFDLMSDIISKGRSPRVTKQRSTTSLYTGCDMCSVWWGIFICSLVSQEDSYLWSYRRNCPYPLRIFLTKGIVTRNHGVVTE